MRVAVDSRLNIGTEAKTVAPGLATKFALWTLLLVYAGARVLQVTPGEVPMVAVVALHVLPAMIFALLHGARLYRWRGILLFLALVLVVGNLFENLGIRTGFPFGPYYFTGRMGPKLFSVPIFLGLAYVGMAYLSWVLASLILGGLRTPLAGSRVFTVPLIAAFIMVAWDLSQEPVWSTILHLWIWPHGGGYFGVPLTNFLGWYLDVYAFYQMFALYRRERPVSYVSPRSGYWDLAILFYSVSAAGNVLLILPQPGPAIVVDPAGVSWRVTDITGTGALVSIFIMGAFAALAWVRLADERNKDELA